MKSFLLLLLFLNVWTLAVCKRKQPVKRGSGTPIVLQFQPDMSSYYELFGESAQVTTGFAIGTPPQKLPLFIETINYDENRGLQVNVIGEKGQFKPSASSTFVKKGKSEDYVATDIVKLPNGQSKRFPVYIQTYQKYWTQPAILHLGRQSKNPNDNFVQSLLKDYKDKVAVIYYEKNTKNATIPPAMTLTLGGRPNNVCSNWHLLSEPKRRPEFSKPNEWLFSLDGLSIDGKSFHLKNKAATFSITGYSGIKFAHNDDVWSSILEGHGKRDDAIKTLKAKKLSYKIGGLDFDVTIEPKKFHLPKCEPQDDWCTLGDDRPPDERNPHHVLPHSVLYDKCLLLDFEKKRISVANRK
ncbi:hypothetical protein M3Y97_01089000 [Aphelenchoides bicaudatus]|nr:hypothetical protein M3Y97_01089000 [Aphelenchoides bicaudatus]